MLHYRSTFESTEFLDGGKLAGSTITQQYSRLISARSKNCETQINRKRICYYEIIKISQNQKWIKKITFEKFKIYFFVSRLKDILTI